MTSDRSPAMQADARVVAQHKKYARTAAKKSKTEYQKAIGYSVSHSSGFSVLAAVKMN